MRCHRSISGSVIVHDHLRNFDHSFYVPLSIVRSLGSDLLEDSSWRKVNKPDYLVPALQTTNPMLFHADTCEDRRLPLDTFGHPFHPRIGVEMQKVAAQRGYKSLYWLLQDRVPDRYDVTIANEEAPRVAVADHETTAFYVNADETSDPGAFNRTSCFDYPAQFFPDVPRSKKDRFLCRKAAIAALAANFTAQGPLWLCSEQREASKDEPLLSLESDRHGRCMKSATFPQGMSAYWLDAALVAADGGRLPIRPGAFLAPGGHWNAADVDLPSELVKRILTYKPMDLWSKSPFVGLQKLQMAVSAALFAPLPVSNVWGTAGAMDSGKRAPDTRIPPVLVPGMGMLQCLALDETRLDRNRRL
jgi:hypothetical protein